MSGNLPEVPPEVDEEFAEAYRAAYLRALEEQSTGARHVVPESHDDVPEGTDPADAWAHRLPRRTGPLRETSAHVAPAEEGTARPVAHQRVRDSRWFVPALLLLIVALLLLGAYLGGRLFAATVINVDAAPATVVTGVAPPGA